MAVIRIVGAGVAALGIVILLICAQNFIVAAVLAGGPSIPIPGIGRSAPGPSPLLIAGEVVGALMTILGAMLTQYNEERRSEVPSRL